MKTKIYCDIADFKQIKKFNKKKNCKRLYHKPKFDEKGWRQKLQKL